MSSAESVTTWIAQIKSGDPHAAQRLWERYIDRLVRRARRALGYAPRRTADEEDVAIVAFEKFLRTVAEGRFPRLEDRHDLWQILVMLAEQTAVDQIRAQTRERRGGTKVRGESVFRRRHAEGDSCYGIDGVAGEEPTPEFAVITADHLRHLLDALRDDELRKIASLKLQGCTNAEIKAELEIGLRSVERKLRLIRTIWTRETVG